MIRIRIIDCKEKKKKKKKKKKKREVKNNVLVKL